MNVKTIDCPTLKKWLEEKSAILIDVREISEYRDAAIPEATLIPLATINLDVLPEFKGKKLVIQCRSGKRSETACIRLLEQDPNLDIYNLTGGILAWNDCGFLIQKGNV